MGGSHLLQQPIPNSATFLNLPLFLQAVAIATGQNPGNVILSNGLKWVLGT